MAYKIPFTLYTPTPCRPIGTSLCLPGGISSTVATMCSRPCARRGWGRSVAAPLSSELNSEHPDLTLEDGNRLRKVIGRDAVLVHDRFACGLGQMLDHPARIVERPVRVVGREEQDLVALHPLHRAGQLRLVLGVVQRLRGELDVVLDGIGRLALDLHARLAL